VVLRIADGFKQGKNSSPAKEIKAFLVWFWMTFYMCLVYKLQRWPKMNTARVSQLYSDEFQQINRWFHTVRPPYHLQEVIAFNALYRYAYPRLSREEKRRVEEFVDHMIERVEPPELAKRIFGVV
jgi:hypothetical protein